MPTIRTVRRVKEVGRRRWKKKSGYHQQARVENTFLQGDVAEEAIASESIIGDQLAEGRKDLDRDHGQDQNQDLTPDATQAETAWVTRRAHRRPTCTGGS